MHLSIEEQTCFMMKLYELIKSKLGFLKKYHLIIFCKKSVRFLESVHYDLVRKMSGSRTARGFIVKSVVALREFSQICRMQNMNTDIIFRIKVNIQKILMRENLYDTFGSYLTYII